MRGGDSPSGVSPPDPVRPKYLSRAGRYTTARIGPTPTSVAYPREAEGKDTSGNPSAPEDSGIAENQPQCTAARHHNVTVYSHSPQLLDSISADVDDVRPSHRKSARNPPQNGMFGWGDGETESRSNAIDATDPTRSISWVINPSVGRGLQMLRTLIRVEDDQGCFDYSPEAGFTARSWKTHGMILLK